MYIGPVPAGLWPADEDVLYNRFPIVLRKVHTAEPCKVMGELKSIELLYRHLRFYADGTVRYASTALLRHMCVLWATGRGKIKDPHRLPLIIPTVYTGGEGLLDRDPPAAIWELSKKIIRTATVNPCKCVGHSDDKAPLSHESAFVLDGSTICTRCYSILFEERTGATTSWKNVNTLTHFDHRFVADTFGALEGFPLRFALIGMALAVASHPTTPLSVGQYILLGRAAWFDPARVLFTRKMSPGISLAGLGTLFGGAVPWKQMSIISKKKVPNIRCLSAMHKVVHTLGYFGYATRVEYPKTIKSIHTTVDSVGELFRTFKTGVGEWTVLWMSMYNTIRELEKMPAGSIELRPVSAAFKAPPDAFAPDVPDVPRRPDGVYTVIDAHLLQWGYLLHLLRTYKPKKIALCGSIAAALRGTPGHDGSVLGGVFAMLFVLRTTVQISSCAVKLNPADIQPLSTSAEQKKVAIQEIAFVRATEPDSLASFDDDESPSWMATISDLTMNSQWSNYRPLRFSLPGAEVPAPSARRKRKQKSRTGTGTCSRTSKSRKIYTSKEVISDSEED